MDLISGSVHWKFQGFAFSAELNMEVVVLPLLFHLVFLHFNFVPLVCICTFSSSFPIPDLPVPYLRQKLFLALCCISLSVATFQPSTPPQRFEKWWARWACSCYFFAPAVLIFDPCTRPGCALVLISGSSCANVWPKQFGQLTQLCLVLGR